MTEQIDSCERANKVLLENLDNALDAVEKGESQTFDQALEKMIKIRQGMELAGCSLKKPIGFERR